MKIGKLKVVQIRKELQDRGLDMTGTRPALMKRLREALQREQQQQQHKGDESTLSTPAPPPRLSDTGTEQHKAVTASSPPQNPAPSVQPSEPSPLLATRVVAEQALLPAKSPPRDPPGPAQTEHEYRNDEHQREGDVGGTQKAHADHGESRKEEGHHVVANGDLKRLNELAHEERMRKRMQRFGAVRKPAPAQKKSVPETAQTVKSTPADELAKINERKRRRAIKFGSALVDSRISQEERERRLKRQRRFQTAGGGTAV